MRGKINKHRIAIKYSAFLYFFVLYFATGFSQSETEQITIYWDASLSMQVKDVDKELFLLDNYFKAMPNADVVLVTFSNSIILQESFNIENSNWGALKEELLNTNYDGVAAYDVLLTELESDINFLFTDGIEVVDKMKIDESTRTYVISSTRKVNSSNLLTQSLKSGGDYINLNQLSLEKAILKLRITSDEDLIQNLKEKSRTTETVSKKEEVTGRVFSTDGVLGGAAIAIKGKPQGVITNTKGEFSIKAAKGDLLEISFLGKTTKTLRIGNTEEVLDIYLIGEENKLDEVLVTGQATHESEKMVETGFGKVNQEKIGYAVKTIDSKTLMLAGASNMSDALKGKMGAVSNRSRKDLSLTVFRNEVGGNPFALIVIDGVPLPRSSIRGMFNNSNKLVDFIDPENVENVTILKGLAATNRYGTEGGAGVILITTKTAIAGKKTKTTYNGALVRGNDFAESLAEVNNSIAHLPYIKSLDKHESLTEVYNAYLAQRNKHLQDPLYFVNVSDFIAQWGDKELSSKILTNILELHPKDVSLLKLVAYKAEQQGDKFLAKRIYEKLMQLKPKDAQSYRDLALSYQETGYYQDALDIYTDIQKNKFPEVSFYGLKKHLESEMKRLILLHKDKLDLDNVPAKYLNIKKVACDARIVFDWNDSMADFELQFVNPQHKFFTWTHTKFQDPKRIEREQIQGFNSEEFLLVGAVKGEWLINVESKLEDTSKPMLIKYTVYKNYGMVNETKVTKLLILNNVTEKQMLGKIVI